MTKIKCRIPNLGNGNYGSRGHTVQVLRNACDRQFQFVIVFTTEFSKCSHFSETHCEDVVIFW